MRGPDLSPESLFPGATFIVWICHWPLPGTSKMDLGPGKGKMFCFITFFFRFEPVSKMGAPDYKNEGVLYRAHVTIWVGVGQPPRSSNMDPGPKMEKMACFISTFVFWKPFQK